MNPDTSTMNLRSIAESFKAGLSPAGILSQDPPAALRETLRISMLWILPLTLLVFLSAALNARSIEQALAASGASLQFQRFAPWNRLFFPVFAGILVLLAASARWVMLSVLDEESRSFQKMLSISALALLPFFAVLLISSFFGNLFPSGGIASGRMFLYGSLAGIVCSLVYEAVITVRLSRTAFTQNTGRAILTWGSSYAGLSVACCGGGVLRSFL
jgi:hypothetical protein